jgi:hypothetical protein
MRRDAAAAAVMVTALAALGAGCGSSTSPAHAPAGPSQQDRDRASVEALERVETSAVDWLAAADPRLAVRTNATAPHDVLERIGTDAVLAEDATVRIHGSSLDIFSFAARGRALDVAGKTVDAFQEPLPDAAPPGSAVARPRLERELLARLVDEERARLVEEQAFGDASGALVRGVVSTWTPPAIPQEWPERDTWIAKHLLEIRDSLKQTQPLTGPLDLDIALYPLERLLVPLQFPRGAAAMAEVRVALEEDMRRVPPVVAGDRLSRGAKTYLGVTVDPPSLPARFARVLTALRDVAKAALDASGGARPSIEARARELLMAERPCAPVAGSRVRSMGPPPERAAVCGVLRAYGEEANPVIALVALHDDVLLASAAVTTSPAPRTGLLSHPDDDVVESVERLARERPVVALAVVLAAELLYADPAAARARIDAWRALGDAPLDVVAREVTR